MSEQLENALRALREADADSGVPADLETKLGEAFRAHYAGSVRRPRKNRLYVWLTGAIAASVAVLGLLRLAKIETIDPPRPPAIVARIPDRQPVVTAIPATAPSVRRPARKAPRQPVRPSREVMTDFMPLPYAPALTSYDRGQVVRVRLPRSSMRTLGLPVNEDRWLERVQADVLMGEDGIVRAVRFVR